MPFDAVRTWFHFLRLERVIMLLVLVRTQGMVPLTSLVSHLSDDHVCRAQVDAWMDIKAQHVAGVRQPPLKNTQQVSMIV